MRIVINSPGYRRYYEGFVSKISVDSFIDKDTPGMRRFYKVEIQYDKEKQKVPEYNEGIQVSVYAISKKMTIFSYIFSLINSNITFNVW
ncbi:hypothetical protein AB1E07_004884 [Salmonella enterica]